MKKHKTIPKHSEFYWFLPFFLCHFLVLCISFMLSYGSSSTTVDFPTTSVLCRVHDILLFLLWFRIFFTTLNSVFALHNTCVLLLPTSSIHMLTLEKTAKFSYNVSICWRQSKTHSSNHHEWLLIFLFFYIIFAIYNTCIFFRFFFVKTQKNKINDVKALAIRHKVTDSIWLSKSVAALYQSSQFVIWFSNHLKLAKKSGKNKTTLSYLSVYTQYTLKSKAFQRS